MIYFVSDLACSSFTHHFWQQASEEVCVRVGSLLCVRQCVLWLILWLWWGTAVRCATATSANHFVSQQWWRKCIWMFVTVFERKRALKYNWTHSFLIWQVCRCVCVYWRENAIFVVMSTWKSQRHIWVWTCVCLSVAPTYNAPAPASPSSPPSCNLMLKYVSEDI